MEGTPSTMITVERNRLLDDGYRQLSLLPPAALKATIRVKFINQQVYYRAYHGSVLFSSLFFQHIHFHFLIVVICFFRG